MYNDNNDENKFSTGKPIEEDKTIIEEQSLFQRVFLHSYLKYIFSFLFSVVIALIVLINKGFNYILVYSDALFIAGFILICVGGLSFVSSLGTFDIFSYSSSYVYKKIKNKSIERFDEFKINKALKRQSLKFEYVPYLVIGLLEVLIAAIILKF